MAKIIKISSTDPNPKTIKNAAEIVRSGGIIVYPTDTAYGLGVNAFDENAIKKLYRIKNRKSNKPTHVIVKDLDMVEGFAIVDNSARVIFEKFLPGPLTMILRKKKYSKLPKLLTGELPTIGVRIPKNLITQSLSSLLSYPYATPSANRSGKPTPYSIEEVEKYLDLRKIDIVLDAGPLPENLPSTLVDLSKESYKILREGPITSKQIHKILSLTS